MRTCLSITAAAALAAAAATAPDAAYAVPSVAVYTYSAAHQGERNSIVTAYDSINGLRVDQSEGSNSYTPVAAALGLTTFSMTNQASASTGVSTTATAAASLVSGTLRASASGSGQGLTGAFDGSGMTAQAQAQLRDRVRFSVAGGGSATVTLTGHIGGQINGALTGFGGASVYEKVQLGNNQFAFFSPADNNFGFYDAFANPPSGWTSYSTRNVTRTGGDFTGSFTVHDAEFMDFAADFQLRCDGKVVCDFMNTASVGFALPAGVSFTSDSGVFLSAVPEPESTLLMLAGLGALGRLARRRRPAAD